MTHARREDWGGWTLMTGASVGFIAGMVGTLSIWKEPGLLQLFLTAFSCAGIGVGWQLLKSRTRWPHLQAVGFLTLFSFVMTHTWFITLQALPAPGGGMNKRDWKSQTVQGEFKAWTDRLNGFGLDIEQEELEAQLWELAVAVMAFRKDSLSPLNLYYRNAGTWQSWRMFVAPHRYPSRLHIELRTAGKWETLYVARSDEYQWNASKLDHDRFRAALFRYGWGRKYPRQWLGFGDWIGREAARDFPDADAVRLKFWSYRTQSPEETREGAPEEGKWIRTRTVRLGERK